MYIHYICLPVQSMHCLFVRKFLVIVFNNCLKQLSNRQFKEFRLKTHLARHLATAHGLAIRAGSPRPVMKTRAAFCLVTSALTRISRYLCKDLLRPRHSARAPFIPINVAVIKQECKFLGTYNYNFDANHFHLRINVQLCVLRTVTPASNSFTGVIIGYAFNILYFPIGTSCITIVSCI